MSAAMPLYQRRASPLGRPGIRAVADVWNRLVEMTFSSTPFPYQEDGTLIVPGHGRLCTTTDLVGYRDMVSIIRDRVQDLIKKGRTLEEIQQANPTGGYRRQYGSETGNWTTRMFCRGDLQKFDSPGRIATMTAGTTSRTT